MLFISTAMAGNACAANREHAPDFYLGAAFASSQLGDDGMGVHQTLDNSTGGLHVFAGYRLDPTLAVELGMDWLGDYTMHSAVSSIDNDYSALTVSLLGRLPLDDEFSLYGQLGTGLATINQHIDVNNGFAFAYGDRNNTGTAGVWGAGFSFIPRTARQFEWRLGYQQVFFDVKAYSIDGAGFLTHANYHQNIRQGYGGFAWHF